jgi:hypothetical protein
VLEVFSQKEKSFVLQTFFGKTSYFFGKKLKSQINLINCKSNTLTGTEEVRQMRNKTSQGKTTLTIVRVYAILHEVEINQDKVLFPQSCKFSFFFFDSKKISPCQKFGINNIQ